MRKIALVLYIEACVYLQPLPRFVGLGSWRRGGGSGERQRSTSLRLLSNRLLLGSRTIPQLKTHVLVPYIE